MDGSGSACEVEVLFAFVQNGEVVDINVHVDVGIAHGIEGCIFCMQLANVDAACLG